MTAVGRRLIRNATLVSMDPEIGILEGADIAIDGPDIVAIGPSGRDAAEAVFDEVVDARGAIVMPGFVDTHRHCWQTQLRRLIPDVNDMAGYVNSTHASLALRYRPSDMYIGSYLAGLSAIDSGITSLVDFSHNSRSAAHIDQALHGLVDSGVRGSLAYGPALAGEWDRQYPEDVRRVRDLAGELGDLTTVRLAAQGTGHFGGPETSLSAQRIEFARSIGVGISVDGIIGPDAGDNVETLGRAGLLGPDITLIHCQAIGPSAWDSIAASGAAVSLTVTSDAQIGIGDALAPIEECLTRGIRPSLSIDVETVLPGDMFTQMRVLLSLQRMMYARGASASGTRIGVQDVLEFATIRGAEANGQGLRTGSITVGKKADLVILRTDGIQTFPSNDPVGTIVSGVDSGAIDTVMVDGVIRKRGGVLMDVDPDRVRALAEASRDHLLHDTAV